MGILSIFALIIYIILTIVDTCMLVRAVCSWVSYFRESKIYYFTVAVTEPIISPIRKLLMRFEWIRRMPLDISFLLAYILISILSSVAYALI